MNLVGALLAAMSLSIGFVMPMPKVSPVVEPLPPTSVIAYQGDASAVVQWEASESPSVFSYTVVASPGGASATVAAPATEAVVTGLVNGVVYSFTVTAINAEGPSNPSWVTNSVTPEPTASGYLVADAVDVAYLGHSPGFGAVPSNLNAPIVGVAAAPDGLGNWLVGADGGVFSFGDARFFGSTGSLRLNAPIVGMAATPDGGGYWLVGADGGVFSFGDARFFGSTTSLKLNAPIVGMAADPLDGGYWLVAADGGVFAFGHAPFYGAATALLLSTRIVGIAATIIGPS